MLPRGNMKEYSFMKIIKLLVLANFLCMFILCGSGFAQAHRVNIFAWLENDNVIVACDFGKDRPARDAEVSVLDNVDKKTLLKGRTGADGRFTFRVPSVVREGHGLIIDVNAGQGHHNEWTMEASELYAAASLTAGFDQAAIAAKEQSADQGQNLPAAASPDPGKTATAKPLEPVASQPPNMNMPLSATETRQIVQEVVERHLAPIHRELASREASGPTVAEIIGGIGWIVGLVGIFLFIKSRRGKQE